MKLGETGVSFKSAKTGKVEHVGKEDVAAAEWLRLANQPALKITQKDLTSFRFGGFKESVQSCFRTFGHEWSARRGGLSGL